MQNKVREVLTRLMEDNKKLEQQVREQNQQIQHVFQILSESEYDQAVQLEKAARSRDEQYDQIRHLQIEVDQLCLLNKEKGNHIRQLEEELAKSRDIIDSLSGK